MKADCWVPLPSAKRRREPPMRARIAGKGVFHEFQGRAKVRFERSALGLGRGEPTYNMSACFAAWMSKPQMWTVPTGQATPTWRCGRYGLGD